MIRGGGIWLSSSRGRWIRNSKRKSSRKKKRGSEKRRRRRMKVSCVYGQYIGLLAFTIFLYFL